MWSLPQKNWQGFDHPPINCHSRESGNPTLNEAVRWMPAFAGMTIWD
jgi:hypothetical protein